MGKYVLTEAAETDLDNIGRYTRDNFGLPQAVLYLSDLGDAMEMLVAHPEAGRERGELARGLRSFRRSSHLIFYRANESQDIEIIRVLHHGQDAESVFEPPTS